MKPIDFENTSVKSPFKVPENYFEESMQRVFTKVGEENKFNKPRKRIFKEVRKWAAVFIIGLLGLTLFFNLQKEQASDFNLEDYLSYQLQWQSVEHENLFDEDDILELELSLNVDPVAIESYLSTQNIENLLIEDDE